MSSEMFSLAPSREDLMLFGFCMFSMVTARYVFDLHEKSVLKTLARQLGGRHLNTSKAVQCSECMFKLVFHLFTSVWAYVMVADKDWFYNTELCYIGHPGHPHTEIDTGIRLFYMIQMAYAMQAILAHFFEPLRKDFLEMFLHHFVTIILIWLSWSNTFWRMGTLVLLVHDISDVPLLAAKVARYFNNSTLTNIMFGICILVWPVTRLYYFPRYLAYTSVYAGQNIVTENYSAILTGMGLLLWVLLALHIFWYRLMLKMLKKSVFKKTKVQDIRSDSEASGSEADDAVRSPDLSSKKRK